MPEFLDARLEKSIFRRTIPSLYRRVGQFFYGNKLIAERYGFKFLLDQSNLIDKGMLYRFGWEGSKYAQFLDYWRASSIGKQETIFLDVGAHWGLYAIRASGEANISRIHAFEPDPRNKAQLAANLFLNDLVDRIEVVDHAVSDEDGEITLSLAPLHNRGTSKIVDAAAAPTDTKTVSVLCEKLDSRFQDRDCCFLIKMDVEGVELRALRGMETLLTSNKVILMVETNSGLASVRDYLENLGFTYAALLKGNKGEDDHLFSNVG